MGWNTSASSKKVVVSDQFRADALIVWPPLEKPSLSILVNGHGPAMQDTRALRNSFPVPASRNAEPIAAFHLPSGEQGARRWQGTFPVFTTWNGFAALPMFTVLMAFIEYLTLTREIVVASWLGAFEDFRPSGAISAMYSLSETNSCRSRG